VNSVLKDQLTVELWISCVTCCPTLHRNRMWCNWDALLLPCDAHSTFEIVCSIISLQTTVWGLRANPIFFADAVDTVVCVCEHNGSAYVVFW